MAGPGGGGARIDGAQTGKYDSLGESRCCALAVEYELPGAVRCGTKSRLGRCDGISSVVRCTDGHSLTFRTEGPALEDRLRAFFCNVGVIPRMIANRYHAPVLPLHLLMLGWVPLFFLPGTSPAEGPRFAQGEVQGVITVPAIAEVSGLVASRNNPDVLWVHNDSGDRAQIYAVDTRGEYLGTFPLAGARAVDYEDIAIGPGPAPGVSYLYVGDIGDNRAVRGGTTAVYRVAEPVVYAERGEQSRTLTAVDVLRLQYPDGPHDAETLLCDPRSGDLYVVTKREEYNRIYRARAPGQGSRKIRLEMMGTMAWTGSDFLGFPLYGAVGGDVSPGGCEILRKRYHTTSLYRRRPGEELSRALVRPAHGIPVPCDPARQGEAIGFDAHGHGYFTLGEGSRPSLVYYRRISDDGPAIPTSLVAPGTAWRRLAVTSDPGTAWRVPGFRAPEPPPPEASRTTANPAPPVPTRYYRKRLHVADAAAVERLTLKLYCGGGGAAVYLNGAEVARVNLAPGAGHHEPATECPPELRDTWVTFPLEGPILADTLVAGANTLALEVHDPPGRLTPVPFDVQFLATPARNVSEPAASTMLGALGAATVLFGLICLWRWRRSRRRGGAAAAADDRPAGADH